MRIPLTTFKVITVPRPARTNSALSNSLTLFVLHNLRRPLDSRHPTSRRRPLRGRPACAWEAPVHHTLPRSLSAGEQSGSRTRRFWSAVHDLGYAVQHERRPRGETGYGHRSNHETPASQSKLLDVPFVNRKPGRNAADRASFTPALEGTDTRIPLNPARTTRIPCWTDGVKASLFIEVPSSHRQISRCQTRKRSRRKKS